MTNEKKKKGLFSAINSREDALRVVRDGSIAFFIVAALQGGIGLFLSPAMLIDAGLFAVLGFLLFRWRSRVAASLLLLLSLFAVIVTVLNRMGIMAEGGTNIVLALIILWIAARAAEAAFKLEGRFREADNG